MKIPFLCMALAMGLLLHGQTRNKNNKAIFLEDISWSSAKSVLTPETVVIIPLGAASKEHGPHLPLATDYIQAEYYKNAIALERTVVIAPTFSYGFYPAFIKYPGSTTTFFSTSRNALLEVIRTISAYGPRRFYVINIGVSTLPVLQQASGILKEEGILLYYSDYARPNFDAAEKGIREKEIGGHADEMESSNILFMRPELADMRKAVDDTSSYSKSGPLTPKPLAGGRFNKSGIIGFATLATANKGKLYSANFTKELLKDIDSITNCALPTSVNIVEIYGKYTGTYTDSRNRSLVIGIDNNRLYYVWNNGTDLRHFFPLFKTIDHYFESMYLDVLFVPDSSNEIKKLWCSFRGEGIWMERK